MAKVKDLEARAPESRPHEVAYPEHATAAYPGSIQNFDFPFHPCLCAFVRAGVCATPPLVAARQRIHARPRYEGIHSHNTCMHLRTMCMAQILAHACIRILHACTRILHACTGVSVRVVIHASNVASFLRKG